MVGVRSQRGQPADVCGAVVSPRDGRPRGAARAAARARGAVGYTACARAQTASRFQNALESLARMVPRMRPRAFRVLHDCFAAMSARCRGRTWPRSNHACSTWVVLNLVILLQIKYQVPGTSKYKIKFIQLYYVLR